MPFSETRCRPQWRLRWRLRWRSIGVVVAAISLAWSTAPPRGECRAADPIRVAVYSDVGAGRSRIDLLRALREMEGAYLREVTADEIRQLDSADGGLLHEFDVLVQPGGSGSKQGRQLGAAGRDAIRDFVRQGGGLIGICAGAYLASADYDWSLHVLDAKVIDRKHWARGTGRVRIRVSEAGRALLDTESDELEIFYGQGPLLAPAGDAEIEDYEPIATYASEIAKNGAPSGVMVGTTAIAWGEFGDGHVLCFSPHPEKTEGLGRLLHQAVERVRPTREQAMPGRAIQSPRQWLAAVEQTPDLSQRGLPNSEYCAPSAAANVLFQFEHRGLLELPKTLSESRWDPELPSSQALARLLGETEFMETRQKRGTNRYRLANGLDRFAREQCHCRLQFHYLGLRAYDKQLLDPELRPRLVATIGVPTESLLREQLANGSGVMILFGSYKPNPEASGRLERVGGHYVTAVGFGHDGRDADPSCYILHDSNDGLAGQKYVGAKPVGEMTELWDDEQRLIRSRHLVQLVNAPIRKDGRIAFLETIFSVRLATAP